MGDKLRDRVTIVTGAGTGIGRAIAIGLAREGAQLVGAARRVDKLSETAKEVEALGCKFLAVRCDVTKKEDCENVVRETLNEFGRIDILVNNAAIYPFTRFLDITAEEWDAVLTTNLRGAAQMCQAVLPQMINQGKGNIIMVNSLQARVGAYLHSHYAASKAALIALTKSLATEYGRKGIRVNGFCCALTPETEGVQLFGEKAVPQSFREALVKTIPLRRLAHPDDYQGIAVFLASDDSNYITGQTISVDGGQTML